MPVLKSHSLTTTKTGNRRPSPASESTAQATQIDATTFRFYFSGRFEPDTQVFVSFNPGSWSDNSGNAGAPKIETFNVYSNAASFEIIVRGSAELYGAVEDLKLVSVVGEAKLSLDLGADSPSARVQLDLNGRADVMYFGTVGAVSGRFIFQIDGKDNSGFWGVMKMDTNFEKLRPAGIDADATGYLQFNFSNRTQIETLTLPGQAAGGRRPYRNLHTDPIPVRPAGCRQTGHARPGRQRGHHVRYGTVPHKRCLLHGNQLGRPRSTLYRAHSPLGRPNWSCSALML
jgi:hypothetical protein